MAHRAILGLGAIAVESAGLGVAAEFRPNSFHACAIVGMYALRPGIGAVPQLESEHASVLGIAVGHVAGRVGVIDGNRCTFEQRPGGLGGQRGRLRRAEQRQFSHARAQFDLCRRLLGKQSERRMLLRPQGAGFGIIDCQGAQRIAGRGAQRHFSKDGPWPGRVGEQPRRRGAPGFAVIVDGDRGELRAAGHGGQPRQAVEDGVPRPAFRLDDGRCRRQGCRVHGWRIHRPDVPRSAVIIVWRVRFVCNWITAYFVAFECPTGWRIHHMPRRQTANCVAT